jgi:ankyrin repeat protein
MPLSLTVIRGHETVMKLLLEKDGINSNSKDILSNRTPLSLAAENKNETVIKLLLAKNNINPNFKNILFD